MTTRDFDKKCATDEELSAFIDGDLDEPTARGLTEHLGVCAVCTEARDELKEMSLGLGALSGEEPPAYLWSKIALKKEREASNSLAGRLEEWWRNWWKVPVLAAAASAAAVVIFLNLGDEPTSTGPDGVQTAAVAKTTDLDQMRALDGVAKAEQVYADAIASLEKSLQDEKSNYSPEVLETIDKSIADIDGAIAKCRSAIKKDPKNIDARKKVLLAYQQKVDLLTDLVVDPM